MIQNYRDQSRYSVVAALVATLILMLLWPGMLTNLLSAAGFIPHGHCYLWKPALVWLHVSSDALIGLSYVSISVTLAYLVYATRQEIPFHSMVLTFGAFIIACGATHFMEVLTLWKPVYWLAGNIKLITAIASIGAALTLPPLVPQARALLQAAKTSEDRRLKLETANQELELLYGRIKELDRVKTQFFANVSHELRTPLALILGPTEQLLQSKIGAEQQRNLELIDRNARSLLRLVNDLLEISSLEAGQVQLHYSQVDLSRLISLTCSQFETLAQQQQITFTVEANTPIAAQVDREKVQRVCLNLLSNAFKFTPTAGAIRCRLQLDTPEAAVLTVEDSGPGVPPELRVVIFERFQTVTQASHWPLGSTGLGLAIVKDFIDLHGGQISISDSSLGGACFQIRLPLIAPVDTEVETAPVSEKITTLLATPILADLRQETRLPSPLPLPAPDHHKPLVLVVEDNPEMNWFISRLLSSDYQIATASNGQEGLAQAIALQPDLVITDMMMPQMSGEELVQQIRQYPELKDTSVILLTARADEKLKVSLLQSGAQDYLTKPFSADELKARVSNLVAMRRARQALQWELDTQNQDVASMATELVGRKRELQKTLEALEVSETRFRSAIVNAPFPIMLHAEDGSILTISRTWTELTGYTLADIPTIAAWTERAYGERRQVIQADIDRLYHLGERLEEGEYVINTAAGNQRTWSFSSAPLGQLPDSRRLVITMAMDVTDRKQLETQLRQQTQELVQANRMKDEFLAVLSHELRTPLNAILGWAKLLRSRSMDTATTNRALETIERNARLQTQLVEDLLDVSRFIQGKLELQLQPIELTPALEAAVDAALPTAVAKNIELTLTVQQPKQEAEHPLVENLFCVQGDNRRLQQVFWNLLSNAIKFTPEGGRVEVQLESRGREYAQITVTDTGVGIAADFLPHVFDLFRQADSSLTRFYSGLGLGLAIVRHLVELHGGTIQVYSAGEGQGSSFAVFLPLVQRND